MPSLPPTRRQVPVAGLKCSESIPLAAASLPGGPARAGDLAARWRALKLGNPG